MNSNIKDVLKTLYIDSITGTKSNVSSESVKELIQSGLLSDNVTITESGKKQFDVVLAGGVFDIIHPGHILTLNAAKTYGDLLIVVVATDKIAKKMKKKSPLHSQSQRQNLVNSLVMVDACLAGNENDIFKTVNLVSPQTIVLGYDQLHQEQFIIDGCKNINLDCKVIRLESPMPNLSSSDIRETYGTSIHGI